MRAIQCNQKVYNVLNKLDCCQLALSASLDTEMSCVLWAVCETPMPPIAVQITLNRWSDYWTRRAGGPAVSAAAGARLRADHSRAAPVGERNDQRSGIGS